MRVVSILLIIALILFTIWQVYLTVKKVLENKKKKSSVVTQNDSNIEVDSINENIDKGGNE